MFLKQYIQNKTHKEMSKSLELLIDFIFVASISLAFSGFIISGKKQGINLIFFALFNASLITSNWISLAVFKQRFEKKTTFFRLNTFVTVIGLACMSIGTSLIDYRSLKPNLGDEKFLLQYGLGMYFVGYIITRSVLAFNYLMTIFANRNNQAIINLSRPKFISRLIVVIIALIHLVFFIKEGKISTSIYIFMPIYLLIEFVGNLIEVKDKNMNRATALNFPYLKERYLKIIVLYISSIFTLGTSHFAFYFIKETDSYMLGRITMIYLIGFLLWWTYSDHVGRFGMKAHAMHVNYLNVVSILISPLLAIFGGLLINSLNDINLNFINNVIYFALGLIILFFTSLQWVFRNENNKETLTKRIKILFVLQAVPMIVVSILLGILSYYFELSIWVFYAFTLVSLSLLAFGSHYLISKNKIN